MGTTIIHKTAAYASATSSNRRRSTSTS